MATVYIGQALPAKIIHTDGLTTLFRYAARELGDATKWSQIADLNGLVDPWVGVIDIKIPQAGTPTNGGIPNA